MESIDIQTHTARAAAGDADSFKMLYEHLVNRVFAYTFARVGNRSVATDVTQDIFIELHAGLKRFSYQTDAAFYAFVFTIARRKLVRQYGEQKKYAVDDFDEVVHTQASVSAETTMSVQSALEMLDDCSREIVVLHHWSRFTFAEIGELINMKESAVRVRHHRARAMLASILTI
jgi:RNA polymerase sigma-70 factor, ECF subfamily